VKQRRQVLTPTRDRSGSTLYFSVLDPGSRPWRRSPAQLAEDTRLKRNVIVRTALASIVTLGLVAAGSPGLAAKPDDAQRMAKADAKAQAKVDKKAAKAEAKAAKEAEKAAKKAEKQAARTAKAEGKTASGKGKSAAAPGKATGDHTE